MESHLDAEEGPRAARGRASCGRCWRHLCGTAACSVGICLVVIGYIVLGALLFRQVEGGAEQEQHARAAATRAALDHSVAESRRQAVERLWNITFTLNVLHKANWTSLTSRQLQRFQTELLAAAAENESSQTPERWGFTGSFLYSLTVITTIGYGTCSPRTDAGKLLTIAYAMLGIPLMLLYLSNIGDILARSLKLVCGACCCCRPILQKANSVPLDAYRPPAAPPPPPPRLNHIDGDAKHHHHHHHHHHQQLMTAAEALPAAVPEAAGSPLPFCLCLVCMLAYMLAGGYLMTLWESWSYLDGAYFCFVSLSTIGFGELTPGGAGVGAGAGSRSQLIAGLYLLLGMALIAMCFNLMQEQAVGLVRWAARRLGLAGAADDDAVR